MSQRAVLWCRFEMGNTEDLTRQNQVLSFYCKEQGMKAVRTIIEYGKADILKLRNFRQMARYDECDVILVENFNVLYFSHDVTTEEIKYLNERGVRIVSVDEGEISAKDHTSKLITYIRYWQAEGESRKTSQRVSDAIVQAVTEGRYRGGATAYGYKMINNGRNNYKGKPVLDIMVDEDGEAPVVRLIYFLARERNMGCWAIAKYLNDSGYKTRHGGLWTNTQVRQILTNPIYKGYYELRQKKNERGNPKVVSPFMPELVIIPEEEWNATQEVMEKRATGSLWNRPNRFIGTVYYRGCKLGIVSSVQYIDDSAFENCVSLTTVVVEREINDITNLGSNVFTGCSSLLQIEVPQNRLAEYKNKENWINYKNKIISDNYTFEEINLNCLTDGSKDVSINAGNNKLLKLNVECVKSYKFITNSDAKMVIYNSCFDTVYSGDNILYAYLNQGTYYIDIRHSSTTSNGTISIAYGLRWKENGEQLLYDQSLNLLTHLHETEDTYLKKIYYINYRGAGFYKFTLSGIDMNENPIVFGDDSLIIYNSSNRIENEILEKCPESSLTASLMQGQNTIYVYLPRNGYFYINILMPSNNYKTLNLTVSSIISQEINLFDLNEGENSIFSVLNNNNEGDYVKELNLKQSGKFTISYAYHGLEINDMLFVLSKLNYNEQTNQYSLETIISQLMDVENNAYTNTLNLIDGIYYIGYFNKKENGAFNISFDRLVTEYNPNTLVTDPERNTDCGSQINVYESDIDIYERSYRSTNIVKGFTRVIYLDANLINQNSREDYYWYSNNDSIATVSQHGTVFGKTCGNVKIMAVNKDNSSIVFAKEFTIIPDTKTYTTKKIIRINDTYKISSNTDYKLGLTIQNSPYPMVQYYTWQIYYRDDTITSVQLDEYGNAVIKGTGEVIFWGKNYIYNNNYEVRIYVKVTE